MPAFGPEARDAVLECIRDTDMGLRLLDGEGHVIPLDDVAVDGDEAGGLLRVSAGPGTPPAAALEVYRVSTGEMVARFEA